MEGKPHTPAEQSTWRAALERRSHAPVLAKDHLPDDDDLDAQPLLHPALGQSVYPPGLAEPDPLLGREARELAVLGLDDLRVSVGRRVRRVMELKRDEGRRGKGRERRRRGLGLDGRAQRVEREAVWDREAVREGGERWV